MRLRATLALLLIASTASAHSLWIDREGDFLVLRSGHFHSGEEADLQEYGPGFVREALCLDGDGAADTLELTGETPFRSPGSCAAVTVFASSGYWTKTPYGTKNLPKDEVEMPIRSGLYFSYVKRIERWSPAMGRPLTRWLEIVPLDDPTALRSGDSLGARVVLDGKPLAGLEVRSGGERIGATDAEGRITIPLAFPGICLIETEHVEPVESEKTDKVVRAATLVVVVGETP
ncbi:MAG: DUF4198 domain-containing protein [Candidatus Eisenbacteria bacterium]|nr:DUF4198 domain-containing protein [Candidatus Eisenbacteria bacterium]